MARYVVNAVLLEGRGPREVASAHGISKSWIYELIKRYRSGGYAALEPRSRRPRSCTHETPVEIVQAIVALRHQLAGEGHDCGPATSRTGSSPPASTQRSSTSSTTTPACSSPPTPTQQPKLRTSWTASASLHGLPASRLSDNGAVFTASPRDGKMLIQSRRASPSYPNTREGR
ncbi:MAG TPA: helix-turn-helix domain-containing protein [Solirubrobacteraceae bacterium]|jgi:hypothetical protein|nr:helix-turn-helix domain-containing protein [Solirubrobacteraceae bacterium]